MIKPPIASDIIMTTAILLFSLRKRSVLVFSTRENNINPIRKESPSIDRPQMLKGTTITPK